MDEIEKLGNTATAKQKEQGYTQQRQYTFFDIDEQESD
jgi:hypothetical protein